MRILLTVAVAAVAMLSGCASQPAAETRPGSLLLGTAQITVNGTDLGLTDAVVCTVSGSLTTITTGTGQSGVTALVSGGDSPVAQSVNIRNLGGFTGNYHRPDGGATVTMTGRSYSITGTADGFTVSQPAIQTSGTFAIEVAC